MVIPAIAQATWRVWVYAIASLTIVRMVAVAIAFGGLKLQLDSTLFIGWFGPRGIASIVYGLLILEHQGLPNGELVFSTMAVTVSLSIFAHGISAFPGAIWYANRIDRKQDIHDRMPEMNPVAELPVRLPWKQ